MMRQEHSLLLVASALFLLAGPAACVKQDCYGARLQVSTSLPGSSNTPLLTVYGYPSSIGRPFPASPEGPLHLERASPPDACGIVAPPSLPLSAALVTRGGCDFFDKSLALAVAGYSAMVLVDTQLGCVFMASNNSAASALEIQAASVSELAGRRLLDALRAHPGLLLDMWLPQQSALDLSAAFLWALAVGCVAAGAALGWREQRRAAAAPPPKDSDDEREQGHPRDHGVLISMRGAALFVVVASAALLALFFMDGALVAAIMSLAFAAAAWQPLAEAALAGVRAALRCAGAAPAFLGRRLALPGGPTLLEAGTTALAVALCCAWLACRDATWAWTLQDLMGVALLIAILRTCLLPDLATAATLLPLAFAYDVWWVFLQPLVTGGPSVMVEVAGGGDGGPRLPMVLMAPLPGPGDNPAMAILGLGDVALPGLLVVLLARWDATHGAGRSWLAGYSAPATLGYAAGMTATYAALRYSLFGDAGQPALLYLVPATLGTTCVLAALRGDLAALWAADLETEWRAAPPGEGDARGDDASAALLAV